MKKTYKISISILLIALVAFSGCKKVIDEDLNVDPNNPADVPLSLLLPSAEGGLGFSLGSDLGRMPAVIVQGYAGLANQHLIFDSYSITESDVNNVFYFNMYGGVMKNLDIMFDKADQQGAPHYKGIAKILMANALGTMTDLFGDIPYTDAFQGSENLTPVYDSQQEIYSTIQNLLSSAITDLNSPSIISPGDDDLIYGGDLSLWTQAAHALSARYWLHLSKVPGSNAYANALSQISGGAIGSNGSNMVFNFGEDPAASSPIYQFFVDGRPGDAGMSAFLINMLIATNDPRLELLSDTNSAGIYLGSNPGEGNTHASSVGSFYASSASPVPFITYPEVKFIEAEAELGNGNAGNAATAYNAAVTASLEYFGVTDSAYLSANANENAGTITLDKIITQKFIAIFTMGYEQWTDWRRTGFPVLTQAPGGNIPHRFPYPNSERLYNESNMNVAIARQGGAALSNRVWWDQ